MTLFRGIFLISIVLFVSGLIVFLFYCRQNYDGWAISIYEGESPFKLRPVKSVEHPVLTVKQIEGLNSSFIADPFFYREDDRWYMFFEVLHEGEGDWLGDIALATSSDGLHWKYESLVIDEDFHLSYPYVFKENDEYYIIPESRQDKSIRLYKASNFPTEWKLDEVLIQGNYADPSLIYYNNKYWIFAVEDDDKLVVFHADSLHGEWKEHDLNPLISNNMHITRPSGRLIEHEGKIIRFTQDIYPVYGSQVRAFIIDTLDENNYSEHEYAENPILIASGKGWNKDGMHHVDLMQQNDGSWLAVVDGFRWKSVINIRMGLSRLIKKILG